MASNDLSNLANNITKAYDKFASESKIVINNILKQEHSVVATDFARFQDDEFWQTFAIKVNEWYSSYKPKYYKRKHSLYSVAANPQTNPEGMLLYDEDTENYDYLYNENNMTKRRDGGSLYDLVFVKGYHGGAYGCDYDPDTPHYRVGSNFGQWGNAAKLGGTEDGYDSVYQSMGAWLKEASSGIFLTEWDKLTSNRWDSITVPRLGKELNDLFHNIMSSI